MKSKKTLFVILAVLLVISIFSGCVFVYSKSFDYDNETPILSLADKRYSKKQIDKLEEEISFSNIYSDYSFSEFKLMYDPECIRKTPFGYYAVLIQDDDSHCFVFWNFQNEIYSIYRTNGFASSVEFSESIVIGESRLSEMRNSNFDFFGYPFSKKVITAHICVDGILLVDYDDNFVVESFDFYSNEELLKTEDDYLKMVPYILPQDKL